MSKFRVGDRVRHLESGSFDTVKLLPGMPEYKKGAFINAEAGFVLKDTGWRRQEDWELVLVKEAPMNLKERIEALTAWDKEADDLLREILPEPKDPYYFIAIPTWGNSGDSIHILDNTPDAGKTEEIKSLVKFHFNSQCSKLTAFKSALLWLAEKAGKLDDKKDKVRKEIAELKERIGKLEEGEI